jgi:hypothetical protein
VLKYSSRNNALALTMVALFSAAAFAGTPVVLKKLWNYTSFKDAGDWNLSAELTKDLKKALMNKGFTVSELAEGGSTAGKTAIEGKITEFELRQNEFDSMPTVSYKTYSASLKIELTLLGPSTSWSTEIKSEYSETSKKLRSLLPGPDEAELANDQIIDFETRPQIKWGSQAFNKSIAGVVRTKVINDLSAQLYTIIQSRPK